MKKSRLVPNAAGLVLFPELAYADFIAANGGCALLLLHVMPAK